jgi:hypothetical protein
MKSPKSQKHGSGPLSHGIGRWIRATTNPLIPKKRMFFIGDFLHSSMLQIDELAKSRGCKVKIKYFLLIKVVCRGH